MDKEIWKCIYTITAVIIVIGLFSIQLSEKIQKLEAIVINVQNNP